MTTDDIYLEELKGTECAYVRVQKGGKKTSDILMDMSDIIKATTFLTKMCWGSDDFGSVRPVHWIVSLLGSEVAPVKLLNVVAGRETQGHRFLGGNVVLANIDDCEEALKSQRVIADADERRGMTLNRI